MQLGCLGSVEEVGPMVTGGCILADVARLVHPPGHLRNAEIVVTVLQRPADGASHGAEAFVVKILNWSAEVSQTDVLQGGKAAPCL